MSEQASNRVSERDEIIELVDIIDLIILNFSEVDIRGW